MIFKRFMSEGLSHFSYMVGSGREAAVVDPGRDVWRYLKHALDIDHRIVAIFETHRHEDLVSGGIELWERTGAPVYHGRGTELAYGEEVKEGDTFDIGSLSLEVLETPGHTDESISISVKEEKESVPLMVFTGDLLFYGDTGRVDLYGEERSEANAEKMYHSIFQKLFGLGDHVVIYPAHGQGSVCGGSITEREVSTIGYEKKKDPLLGMDRSEFILKKLKEEMERPSYFDRMEKMNTEGPPLLTRRGDIEPMDLETFMRVRSSGAQVVDTRHPCAFAGGHVPGSLNIWMDGLGQFAGWMLDDEGEILLLDWNGDRMEEARIFLERVGLDNVKGYLSRGFDAYAGKGLPLANARMATIPHSKELLAFEDTFILDVRNRSSWERGGHIGGALRIFVGELPERIDEVPRDKKVLIYCDTGFKTGIAASVLLQHGYHDVHLLQGGLEAWNESGMYIEH